MKRLLLQHRMEEYVITGALMIIIFLCGLLAVALNSDVVVIFAATALLAGFMVFAKELEPAHFLYALCFGIPVLPYINLQMFPLSGVYIVALLFVMLSLISLLQRGIPIQFPAPTKWMFLFLAIAAFSVLIAPNKRGVIVSTGQFFVYTCVYLATVNILRQKTQIIRALKYILYGSLIPIGISLLQLIISFKSLQTVIDLFYEGIWGKLFMGARGLERISNPMVLINRGSNVGSESSDVLFRVFGTFEGPTSFGGYLLTVTVFAVALYIIRRNKKRIVFTPVINGMILGILALFLLLTWTRAAWLAFFLALAFILAYKNEHVIQLFTAKNVKLLFFIVLIPAGILLTLFILKIPLATQVLVSTFKLEGSSSTAGRIFTILFALQYISNNPLMGIGFGNYGFAAPDVSMDASTATFASAHNRFLTVGVELGLTGLIALLLILYALIKQPLVLIKAPVRSFYHTLGITFLAFWIGFLIKSSFAGSIIHPRLMTLLWVVAGIQTAVYHLYLHDKAKEHTVYRLETAH